MTIEKVWFDDKTIFIQTDVGHIIGNPLSWFPRLANASPQQRANYEISPFGIHWEELDKDLSLDGFFNYKRSATQTIIQYPAQAQSYS